ncbi:GNAT family N-acetyltransferase [Rhodococcus sp. NPDC049939]|uniref:GNAT family N-acetyltransferase n=1 Tax=Rhodococcus sp. NPDC049939 TaxID=3155511 RepID=UPI0033C99D44
MRPVIERADFDDPRLVTFLQAHLDDLAPDIESGSCHALDVTKLMDPSVRLWVVRDRGEVVATGALAMLDPGHEELKSMRTAPEQRGRGIARALLEHLIQDARRRRIERISLETGSADFFEPARRLYATADFEECPPFGHYSDDPNSTFMTLKLS